MLVLLDSQFPLEVKVTGFPCLVFICAQSFLFSSIKSRLTFIEYPDLARQESMVSLMTLVGAPYLAVLIVGGAFWVQWLLDSPTYELLLAILFSSNLDLEV